MFIVFSLSLLAMLHARPILIKFDHHVFYKLHYYCDYQYITVIADFSELVYRFQDFYYKVFTCCLLIVQTQKVSYYSRESITLFSLFLPYPDTQPDSASSFGFFSSFSSFSDH